MKWRVRLDWQNQKKVLAGNCLSPKSFSARTSLSCPPFSSASASPGRSSSGPRSSSTYPPPGEKKIIKKSGIWLRDETHHFLLLFFNLLLILLHYFVQMFPPFLFIFLKEQRLNLLQFWQRCNNVSSWSPAFSDSIHHSYSILEATWPLKRNSHMLSFLWWIIYEIWASFTNYLWSYFWKANPWQSGSTGTRLGVYHRKKNGAKIQKNTYVWPILDHCSQTVSQGCCFWGKFLGLPVKRPKVGLVEEATLGSIISTRNRRDFRR